MAQANQVGRARWRRTGLVVAAVWLVALIGFSLIGFAAIGLWAGPIVVLIVGRLHELHQPGEWIRAGLLAIGVFALVFAIVAVAAFVATYG